MIFIELCLAVLLGGLLFAFWTIEKKAKDIITLLGLIIVNFVILVGIHIIALDLEANARGILIEKERASTQLYIDSLKFEIGVLEGQVKSKFMFPPPKNIKKMKGPFET